VRILIFTRRILEFYFDFFMCRAVLLLPALLCATRKRKSTRQIQTLRERRRFTASKPHFADKAKFAARKFHILREARKFRPLQAIAKFRLSQAALNFKISPLQNGCSY
jgi:hypothetical protein